MNILILGSGGREHAIAWKASNSKLSDKIFVAPGNAGTNKIANNIAMSVNDFDAILNFIEKENITLVIVGPEDPLVNDITNFLRFNTSNKDLIIIGPSKAGALLEGSKDYAKEFMQKYNIPTAKYFTAKSDNLQKAIDFLESVNPPYVLKADGLAAGKGVLILDNFDTAVRELEDMLKGKFVQLDPERKILEGGWFFENGSLLVNYIKDKKTKKEKPIEEEKKSEESSKTKEEEA